MPIIFIFNAFILLIERPFVLYQNQTILKGVSKKLKQNSNDLFSDSWFPHETINKQE